MRKLFIVSTIICETINLALRFSSAGTAYHGANSLLVALRQSS